MATDLQGYRKTFWVTALQFALEIGAIARKKPEYQRLTNFVILSNLEDEEIFPMNVSLTRELDKFVATKVASGRYTSASEVVREALRLLEEQDKTREARLGEFNRELKRRLEPLDRGEFVEPEVVWAELERKSREWRKQRA